MSMQSDVLSSAIISASGNLKTSADGLDMNAIRVRMIYYVASGAGTVNIREGGSAGPKRISVPIAAAASFFEIPGEGVLIKSLPYMELVSGTLTGMTVFYS